MAIEGEKQLFTLDARACLSSQVFLSVGSFYAYLFLASKICTTEKN